MNDGFFLPNAKVYALMLPESIEWKYMNSKWSRLDDEATWTKIWKALWNSDLTRRAKLFLWQICMNGLYTQEHATKLGKEDGCCKSCLGYTKDLEHIFFNYLFAQRRWVGNAIFFEIDPTHNMLELSPLIHTLTFLMEHPQRHPMGRLDSM